MSRLLQRLYDLDVLDEEVLLEWAKKPSKKYVSRELSEEMHARAEPFIKWLREAEEESDSESEEDDVEVRLSADRLRLRLHRATRRGAGRTGGRGDVHRVIGALGGSCLGSDGELGWLKGWWGGLGSLAV